MNAFSLSSSTTLNNLNSEITSEPFVTVTHRRRLIKERRQDNNTRSSRLLSSSNTSDKRHFQPTVPTQNGLIRPTIRNDLSNIKSFVSTTTTKEENTNRISSSPPLMVSSQPIPQTTVLPSSSSSVSNHLNEPSLSRLSTHSSSSSLSSLLKRQSKPPPVVFLNKSIDIELDDVSFGFDVENPIIDKLSTDNSSPILSEKENEIEESTRSSTQTNDSFNNSKSSRRSYQQQRSNRGLSFYSGSDIRPHYHHRNYLSHTPVSQSPYIDPLLLLQYNQQRFAASYSQQLAYINLLRTQYLSTQSPYILIPTTYATTTNDIEHSGKTRENENIPTSEQIQEPLFVYTPIPTQTSSIYLHPTKKSYYELEQLQQTTIPTIYSAPYFYPTQPQHVISSQTAYFQPVSSPTLLTDSTSQYDRTDDEEDNNHEKSLRLHHQTSQQSSSQIMSNALQLVYSQEKKRTQIDHFNLDELTAYLAIKWADTVNCFREGNISNYT